MKILRNYIYCMLTFLTIGSSLALSKKKYCCLINKLNTITNIVNRGSCNENVVLISQADIPYTITQPGRYCLVEDIVVTAGQDAITIDFDAVTGNLVSIDLNGYTITGLIGGVPTGRNGIVGTATISGLEVPAGVEITNGKIVAMIEHGIYIPLGMGVLLFDGLTLQSCGFAGGPTNGGIVIGNTSQIIVNPVIQNTHVFGADSDYGVILINPQDFSILNSASSFNGKDGFNIQGTVEFIPGVISMCTASGNGGNGFVVSSINADTKFLNCVAAANSLSGFLINGNQATISECQSTSNSQDGFSIMSNNNTITFSSAAGNNGNGFAIISGSNNDIQTCVSLGNGNDGFLMTTTANQINGNTASGNANFGFESTLAGNRVYSNFANDNGTNYSGTITNVAVSPIPSDPINFTTNISN